MKIRITHAFDSGVCALLCCGAALVLTACGGGSSSLGSGAQNQASSDGAASQPVVAAPADGSTVVLARSSKVPTSTYHLYVATTGSDGDSGSETAPFRTITRAAKAAKPSTTIHVAPGVYFENVRTSASGNATGRIRYVSDSKWGAQIIGSGTEAMWTNSGSYTDIAGFDISGSGRLGIANWASNTSVSGNHVHDLTISGGCTGDGGAGIVNANYNASDGDIIGNVVHDIGEPGACSGIQGIYHSNLRGNISNNIVYRVSAYGIHLWHAANNVVIANNTSFANGSRSMGGGIVIGSGDSPGGIVLDNTQIINNIVYNNPRASIEEYCYWRENCIGENITIANNLVYGNGSGISLRAGSASGTIAANPQFVNYQPDGIGDYRLRVTSPAIDQGVPGPVPATDIDNAARLQGEAVDLGAYENY